MDDYKIMKFAKEVKRRGGLKHEEVFEYFRIIEEKKKQNIPLNEIPERDILILVNDGLIYHVINTKINASSYDFDDLVSIGRIGLVKAVDTFNPNLNFKFATYAVQIIRNEILMEFRRQSKKSNVPETAIVNLSDTFNTGDLGEELTYEDTIYADDNFVEEVINILTAENIYKLFIYLNEKEQLVLTYGLGLFGKTPTTQTSVAEIIGTGRANCTRKIQTAIKKLRILSKNYKDLSRDEKFDYYNYTSKRYPLIKEAEEYLQNHSIISN